MYSGWGIRRKQNRIPLVQYDTGSVLGVTPGDGVFFGYGGIVEIKIQGVSGIGNWRHTVIFSLSAILLRSAILVSYCVDMQLHCN